MLEEYLPKPLQGVKFCAFRDLIMGIPEKVSGPRPSSYESNSSGRIDKANEVKYDPDTSHTNNPRIRFAGVRWNSVNGYHI